MLCFAINQKNRFRYFKFEYNFHKKHKSYIECFKIEIAERIKFLLKNSLYF